MRRSAGNCCPYFPFKHNLHKRIQDHPHRHEQKPEDEHGEATGKEDIVELSGAVILRECVKFRAESEKGEDQTRNAEEHERPAETDEPDDVHKHLDAVGDRVLA